MSHTHNKLRLFAALLTAALLGTALLGTAVPAFGVSLIATDSDPAVDLVNEPDNHYSFDPGTITWSMTPPFAAKFSSPVLLDQVRRAFKEWHTASISQNRRNSPKYSWTRWNGARNFCDLRTILTHEIGHALGSQHPDAAWFNDGGTGVPYHLNFHPDGVGGFVPGAPFGGEIMNEGNGLPYGLAKGEYWRIVSKDELAMLDHAYGGALDFVELPVGAPADIILDLHNVGGAPSGNLGVGGINSHEARVPGDASQGRRTLEGLVSINDGANCVIGIEARMSNWELTNQTGKPIVAVSIRTRGTDNENALASSSSGAHGFQNYLPSNTVSATEFEDRNHRFFSPVGGVIPVGDTVGLGLRLDVWDWTVVHSIALAWDGSLSPVGLVTVFGFVAGEATATSGSGSSSGGSLTLDLETGTNYRVTGKGFQVRNDQDDTIDFDALELAWLTAPGTLEDLGSDALDRLRQQGRVRSVAIPRIRLAPGERHVFVLEGEAPRDLLDAGEATELQVKVPTGGGELMVVVDSWNDSTRVRNFSLIDSAPITGGNGTAGTPNQ